MEDLLIDTLRQHFGIPVVLQGSLLDDEPYPDRFFTFWNRGSDGGAYYDNKEITTEFLYDLNYYSTDPADVYATMRAAIAALKSVGFIIGGDGYSVASDEPTHDGRGVAVMFLRNNM